jgi:hypothetical protein
VCTIPYLSLPGVRVRAYDVDDRAVPKGPFWRTWNIDIASLILGAIYEMSAAQGGKGEARETLSLFVQAMPGHLPDLSSEPRHHRVVMLGALAIEGNGA